MLRPETTIPNPEAEQEGQLRDVLLKIAGSTNSACRSYLGKLDEWCEEKGVRSWEDLGEPKRLFYFYAEFFGSGFGAFALTAGGLEFLSRKLQERLEDPLHPDTPPGFTGC